MTEYPDGTRGTSPARTILAEGQTRWEITGEVTIGAGVTGSGNLYVVPTGFILYASTLKIGSQYSYIHRGSLTRDGVATEYIHWVTKAHVALNALGVYTFTAGEVVGYSIDNSLTVDETHGLVFIGTLQQV